jgi:hypothetical protein
VPRSSRSGLHRVCLGAFEVAPLVENGPGDPSELVGQRDRQHIVVHSRWTWRCSFDCAPSQTDSLEGQEHRRTIPLAEMAVARVGGRLLGWSCRHCDIRATRGNLCPGPPRGQFPPRTAVEGPRRPGGGTDGHASGKRRASDGDLRTTVKSSIAFERNRNAGPSALLRRNGPCRFGEKLLMHFRDGPLNSPKPRG